MPTADTQFAGSIPQLYDRHLGPMLFHPYAVEVARRAAAIGPRRILEIASGTGIVTKELALALPDAELVATDLNQAMLDVAASKIEADHVRFQVADALDLPFADDEFDLAVVQFGVMFYPDKVKGNAEARRVLRDGGTYLAVIWDNMDRNNASKVVQDAIGALYPDNPPAFLARAPFGYSDTQAIERDLRAAGFSSITIETVGLDSEPVSAAGAATGLVAGSPLSSEILERDPDGLQRAVDAVAKALLPLERDGRLQSRLSSHIVTAVK